MLGLRACTRDLLRAGADLQDDERSLDANAAL